MQELLSYHDVFYWGHAELGSLESLHRVVESFVDLKRVFVVVVFTVVVVVVVCVVGQVGVVGVDLRRRSWGTVGQN